jgi:hypothetical protein
MNKVDKYRIPDEYFFRLHHVRPRFKNDVEEVLLYVATSISEMHMMDKKESNTELNRVLTNFIKLFSDLLITLSQRDFLWRMFPIFSLWAKAL